jgi:hypothetical protein
MPYYRRRYRRRTNWDPYWTQARFQSACDGCSITITKGEKIYYYPRDKKVYCEDCGEDCYRDFMSHKCDEDVYHGTSNPYAG